MGDLPLRVQRLLLAMLSEIVSAPDTLSVSVREDLAEEGQPALYCNINVPPMDRGRVIGAKGALIQSLRVFFGIVGARNHVLIYLTVPNTPAAV